MDKRTKKAAAAIAAVMTYIKTEEEAICMESAMTGVPEAAQPMPSVPLKLWGISGRQTQMQMRSLMQMKGFHR